MGRPTLGKRRPRKHRFGPPSQRRANLTRALGIREQLADLGRKRVGVTHRRELTILAQELTIDRGVGRDDRQTASHVVE